MKKFLLIGLFLFCCNDVFASEPSADINFDVQGAWRMKEGLSALKYKGEERVTVSIRPGITVSELKEKIAQELDIPLTFVNSVKLFLTGGVSNTVDIWEIFLTKLYIESIAGKVYMAPEANALFRERRLKALKDELETVMKEGGDVTLYEAEIAKLKISE